MAPKNPQAQERFGRIIWLGIIDGLAIMAVLCTGVFIATLIPVGLAWIPMALAVIVASGVDQLIEHWDELRTTYATSAESDDRI